VATDKANNRQPTPSAAQTTTLVDISAPSSNVAALPHFSPGNFTVRWSGNDGSNGSGIKFYDVYVSDNGGPFAPFVSGTTALSANFGGQDGHTYGFYSVATDNANNRQATPTAAQTSTTVDAVPPSSSASPLPLYSLPSFTVNWSGSDNAGGSGVAFYDMYVADDGGPFAPWLTGTTATSATYGGQDGHACGFYSVATDIAGNRQTTATSAQATTEVDITPPTSAIQFPAAGGSYNASGWASTISGAAIDNLTGVQQVRVSILDNATSTYWNGTGFSSSTEVFQTATLTSPGAISTTWSLSFVNSNFPADGSYRVHTLAADKAGNGETARSSATFTYDNVAPTTTDSLSGTMGTTVGSEVRSWWSW
jgi:hypothetical protein